MPTDTYSDLYALGATLYHLITGTAPVDSLKRINQKRATQKDPLRSISELIKGVPQTLASLIMKSLSLDPRHAPLGGEVTTTPQIGLFILRNHYGRAHRRNHYQTASKPSILSRNHQQMTTGEPSHSRIAIDLVEPTTDDFRTKRVVSLAAYKEASQPANAGSIRKVANIAIMISASWVTSQPTSTTLISIPLRSNGTTPHEFSTSGLREPGLGASVKSSRLLRPIPSAFTEAVYLTDAPALPPSHKPRRSQPASARAT